VKGGNIISKKKKREGVNNRNTLGPIGAGQGIFCTDEEGTPIMNPVKDGKDRLLVRAGLDLKKWDRAVLQGKEIPSCGRGDRF